MIVYHIVISIQRILKNRHWNSILSISSKGQDLTQLLEEEAKFCMRNICMRQALEYNPCHIYESRLTVVKIQHGHTKFLNIPSGFKIANEAVFYRDHVLIARGECLLNL